MSRTLADSLERRRLVVLAGHAGDLDAAIRHLADDDEAVRACALGAVARCGSLTSEMLRVAATDRSPVVRRRAAELSASSEVGFSLLALLDDDEAVVAEAAAFAAGERYEGGLDAQGGDSLEDVLERLSRLVCEHPDPLVREAAVAAAGSIGADSGLPVVLAAMQDRVSVRRRAVVALAAFDADAAEEALLRATEDRDWQVRQAAGELR